MATATALSLNDEGAGPAATEGALSGMCRHFGAHEWQSSVSWCDCGWLQFGCMPQHKSDGVTQCVAGCASMAHAHCLPHCLSTGSSGAPTGSTKRRFAYVAAEPAAGVQASATTSLEPACTGACGCRHSVGVVLWLCWGPEAAADVHLLHSWCVLGWV